MTAGFVARQGRSEARRRPARLACSALTGPSARRRCKTNEAKLAALLVDESSAVRAEAAVALGTIADPRSIKALCATLEREAEPARLPAAEALLRIEDKKVLDALTSSLVHADPEVRLATAAALAKYFEALTAELPKLDETQRGCRVARDAAAASRREPGRRGCLRARPTTATGPPADDGHQAREGGDESCRHARVPPAPC
jgi:HEAT repeats